MRVSVCVRRDTVERGRPQRLEISRLPSRASWPSKQRRISKARETTWITSPSPARSLASMPCLLSRSERRPTMRFPHKRRISRGANPLDCPRCAPPSRSTLRDYIPLAGYATSGNLRRQHQAARFFSFLELSGRVGATPIASSRPRDRGEHHARDQDPQRSRRPHLLTAAATGDPVNEGDEVAFVEAMKMEIPVASPAAGKIKSMIVAVDDVVAAGQLLGTVET